VLNCSGAAVFTAGANMIIPGIGSGSNFTAAANTMILVTALTTTQFMLNVFKADGTPVVSANTNNGQCQLQYVGTTSIKLVPWNGNLLMVNGTACTVPDAGVTLANTGLTASTKYYIYAVATAGAISSLEASTTAYAVDTATGNKGVVIKTGDSTRTLVGMVYMDTGTPGTFADTATKRYTRSWFNDLGIGCNSSPSSASTTSTTYVKADSASDIGFVVWSNELVQLSSTGSMKNSATANYGYVALGIDGTSAEDAQSYGLWTDAGTVDMRIGYAITTPAKAYSEGFHTLSLLIANAAGATTSMFTGGAAPSSTPTTRATFGLLTQGINR
jgi:hypothetical protein